MAGADLRRLDALLHLRNALLRFRESTSGVAGQLRARIDRAEAALARRKARLQAKIETHRATLSRSTDERERYEARGAFEEASEELAEVRRRMAALSAAVAQYKRSTPSWHHAMQRVLPAAAAFLAGKHADAVGYLNIGRTAGTSGQLNDSAWAKIAAGETEDSITFRRDHILHGEFDREGKITGGHFLGASKNFEVVIWNNAGMADKSGLKEGYVEAVNPITGERSMKRSTFLPEDWDEDRAMREFETAFRSETRRGTKKWRGISPSGVRFKGYNNSGRVDGYPVYQHHAVVPSLTLVSRRNKA